MFGKGGRTHFDYGYSPLGKNLERWATLGKSYGWMGSVLFLRWFYLTRTAFIGVHCNENGMILGFQQTSHCMDDNTDA